jgi:drug/metabolite transporter (DMT)-like permease
MIKQLTVLMGGLVLEAIGVVLLSKGLKTLGTPDHYTVPDLLRFAGRAVSSAPILIGVAFEAGFFGCLLYLMSRASISFIWPLTSMGPVLTTAAAYFILREPVSALRWAGVLLMVIGALVITYTEKVQRQTSPPSSVSIIDQSK